MLDQLIEKTYNDLIRSFPPTSSYSLQDLSAASIRPDLYKYLSFVLEERSEEEINRIEKPLNPWFDYSDSDISDAWSSFVLTLKKHPVIPSSKWASVLHDAVATLTAFTLTPIAGLEQILFGDSDSLRASLAEGKLKRLNSHPVILDAANRVCQSSDSHFVQRAEFKIAIPQSVADATKNYTADDWETFTAPVFDCATSAIGDDTCPLEVVTAFFDDLGLRDLANRVHTHATRYKLTELDSSQLYDALIFRGQSADSGRDVLMQGATEVETTVEDVSVEEAMSPEAQTDWQDPEPSSIISEPSESPQVDQGESEDDDTPAPLWKKFQKKLNAPVVDRAGQSNQLEQSSTTPQLEVFDQPVELPPHRPGEGALSDYSTGDAPSVPIWERFRDRVAPDGEVSDFSAVELRVLGESVRKNRQRFIATLFGGSQEEYEDVIRRIDHSSNWDEASLYIADAVFRKHRVNIYSELAVSFTNAVEQRYRAIQAD